VIERENASDRPEFAYVVNVMSSIQEQQESESSPHDDAKKEKKQRKELKEEIFRLEREFEYFAEENKGMNEQLEQEIADLRGQTQSLSDRVSTAK
jgi:septal ring factor EnvC (AmiA/AmiB activator)